MNFYHYVMTITNKNLLFSVIISILFSMVALIVRFSSLDIHRPLGGDEVEYHALAVRLWEGRGFSDKRGNPTAYRAPGLPVLLAFLYRLNGPDPKAARVAMAAVGGLSSGLLVLLTSRVFNVYAGALAGMIWTFTAFNLALNGSLLGETPAAFMLLAARVMEAIGSEDEADSGRLHVTGGTGSLLFFPFSMVLFYRRFFVGLCRVDPALFVFRRNSLGCLVVGVWRKEDVKTAVILDGLDSGRGRVDGPELRRLRYSDVKHARPR